MYKNKELMMDPEEGGIDSCSRISIKTEWKEKKQSLFFRKYYEEISREKEEIDKLNNNEIWDKMKKIGNPFELIFTTYHRKRKNDSISKYIPLSRSYFKMWEIYNNFPIFQYFPLNTRFRLAHLAEGPGGFMEASYNYIQHLRSSHYHKTQLKHMMNKDVYHGITLKPHNDYVPDWNKIKKIFGPESNIHVHYGNLYIYEDVVKYCGMFKGSASERAHIVTADGGFDYSSDFNGQELNSCQIIYSEMAVALNVLAKHGTFICKVFDLFSIPMMKMLEILKQNFEYLYIYKPETSRPANSEKYIVCMNYLDLLTEGEKDHLLKMIQEWNDQITCPSLPPPPPPPPVPPKPDAMILVDGKQMPAHLLNDPNDDSLSCACCGNTKKDEMMITAFLKAQKKLLGIKEDREDGESDPKDSIGKVKKKRKKKSVIDHLKEEVKEGPKEEVTEKAIEESKEETSEAERIRNNYYIDFSGIKISKELIYLLNDYNNKYMECQKRSLQKTLTIAKKNPSSIIEKEDYEMLIRQQVKNAYNWCTKYNIPINEESIYWQKYKGFI
jgi:23S rRNA U2552 (ribose-2'-O)-methylase RlmE/FtsJ